MKTSVIEDLPTYMDLPAISSYKSQDYRNINRLIQYQISCNF